MGHRDQSASAALHSTNAMKSGDTYVSVMFVVECIFVMISALFSYILVTRVLIHRFAEVVAGNGGGAGARASYFRWPPLYKFQHALS